MDGTTSNLSTLARRLGGALEPVIGQVYFSPESHANYQALGFSGNAGVMKGVELPDGVAYFTSRGSLMGQVNGHVIAAAFGVFNPDVVVPSVTHGWSLTDAATICDARDRGAIAQLERILGPRPDGIDRVDELLARATAGLEPAGRPLAAGVMSQAPIDHPLGALFRHGDLLREYRGDSHTAAWVHAGFSAIEIGLLTELYWGLPLRTYTRSRGWTDDQFDNAEAGLEARDLIANGAFTKLGRSERERIESATDAQMAPVFAALGDDAAELIDHLVPWGNAIRSAHGYPASGPHDLAERSTAF